MIDPSIKEREKANENFNRLIRFASFLRIIGGGGSSDGSFLSVNFSTGVNIALVNGSVGVAGLAQKLDNTFQSFAGGVLRKTDRGAIVESASQNFIAASSNLNNAAWTLLNTFTGVVAKTSILPGETAYEYESDTTAGAKNCANRGTYSAGVETFWQFLEAMPSATICSVRMVDQSNGNVEVISMDFTFFTNIISQRGNATSRKFGYIDFGAASGPNGGRLYLLILSGIAPTAGNTRRCYIYPNGSSAGAAGRKTVVHHVQHEIGAYATSPIINPSTTSLTRAAEVITINVPTGTYDVRFTLQDGTIIDRYGIISTANLLTIPTDITQNVPIQIDDATLQLNQRIGSITSISIWSQSIIAQHGLGDNFAISASTPYIIPKWLPVKLYRPSIWTFDGVGSSLAQQATRFDGTSQYYGDILIILDGALTDTLSQATGAINNMLSHLTTNPKKWLYIESGPDANFAIGSPTHTTWLATTAGIKAAYPNNFVDTKLIMQSHGDGSANDNSDIANDWWPRSLRFDNIYPNNLGSQYYAQIIDNAIQAKGLLSPYSFQTQYFSRGVYYGDSLVLGAGASQQINRWTTLLSGRFSVTENNFGVGGQTIMQVPINNFIVSDFITKPTDSAIIFLEWGVNDANRFFVNSEGSLSQFIADYTTAINFLLTSRGWSKKDIIIITGIDYEPITGITRAQYFTFADALVVLCENMGIKYVTNFPHYTKTDTVHPDDAGHIVFANHVEVTMRNTYSIVSL